MEQIKRAAAYGRVSTNSKAQEHSFENQSAYWHRRLVNDPSYEFVGLYADKGISGSSLRLRPQMLALLDACRRREIDIVFTKSVQRFARNTTELLETVRELRELGVAVVFEKEGINTINSDSDLTLTIAAAVAEDDLSRYGQNVAWAIREGFEKGELTVVGVRLYGYETVKKQIRIVPHEAKVVKMMFELYSTGKWSSRKIARYLEEKGIKTTQGMTWKSQQVIATLKNEKYKGDALLYKSYNIKGRTVVNKGERDMFYVENSHEPIVSKELWDKVKKVMDARANTKLRGQSHPVYPFTGLIKCPICGKGYVHKVNSSGTKYACGFYRCTTQMQYGIEKCANTGIKESVIEEKFIEAYNEFVEQKRYGEEENDLHVEFKRLNNEERELIALKARGLITLADYEHDRNEITRQRKIVEYQIKQYRSAYFKRGELKPITECDENLISRVVKEVTIRNWVVTFEFYNGVKISRTFTNGCSGNQKGWKEKQRMKEKQNGNQ